MLTMKCEICGAASPTAKFSSDGIIRCSKCEVKNSPPTLTCQGCGITSEQEPTVALRCCRVACQDCHVKGIGLPAVPAGNRDRVIVAEISKTWVNGSSQSTGAVSQQFEQVIRVNAERGYILRDFSFSQVRWETPGGPNLYPMVQLVETIIAVFDLEDFSDKSA